MVRSKRNPKDNNNERQHNSLKTSEYVIDYIKNSWACFVKNIEGYIPKCTVAIFE